MDIDLSVCCVKGCDKPSESLGLCINHWRRNRKYGSPVAYKITGAQFQRLTIEERFWSRVRKGAGCWLWAGGVDDGGYGRMRCTIEGRVYNTTHRISYVLDRREHPGSMSVCHSCDNPRCVRPDHLFLGTNADNQRDKHTKGRARVNRGENRPHAKLTEAQVRAIMADARPYPELALDYGVAATTIGSIKGRFSWAHVDAVVEMAKRVGNRKGVSDKFTPDDIRFIRASGLPGKELALKYGCSQPTISDIRKRRSWAHVE